jgi:alanyl-tRNA synthetase
MRRALRHGKLLEQKDPFFHHITEDVIAKFQDVYPDLAVNHDFIQKVVTNEEDNFNTTLTVGTQRLDEILDKMKQAKSTTIPGEEIFKLYDTFGFPVDLVEETAKDTGYTLDMDGFNKAMKEQKEKAMTSWKGSGESRVAPVFNKVLQKNGASVFTGYGNTHGEGKVVTLIKNKKSVQTVKEGDEFDLLVDQTPFYGESGGQVGDAGRAYNDHAQLDILKTTRPLPNLIVHHAKVVQGTVKVSDPLTLEVDTVKRNDTAQNHSATHLLHAALKEVLGGHVKQGGSLVAPDRLRFDYTHFSPLTDKERARIEALVNEKIRENIKVDTDEMDIETALKKGAVALFGEKYGDSVRVVSVSGFSKELCGGTHVSATGNIGFFKILQETGIASGVRRIEAVTGPRAYERIQKEFDNLSDIRSLIKAQPDEELSKLKKLIEKNKELEKQVASMKEKLVLGKKGEAEVIKKVGDTSLLVEKLDGVDAKTLRSFVDDAKNRLKSVVVVVGAVDNGKVLLAAGVTKDLMDRYHAGNILKKVAEVVGGSGGGRPDMAQAGGSKPEKLDEALGMVASLIQS